MRPPYPPPPAPYPRHLYSKPVLIGLIGSYAAAFYFIGIVAAMTSNPPIKPSLEGPFVAMYAIASFLLLGNIIAVLIMDARGFVTLNGMIKWRRIPLLLRLVVGYFAILLSPYMLVVYYIQAFRTYRQANAARMFASLPAAQPSPDLVLPKAFLRSRPFKALLLGGGALVAVIITITIAAITASPTDVDPLAGRLVPVVGYLTAIPAIIYGHRTLKHLRQSYGRTPSTRLVIAGLWCGYITLGLAFLTTPQAIWGPF